MRRRHLAAALLGAGVLLGGCGTAPARAPAPATASAAAAEVEAGDQHNDTDVMFLQMLIHHQKQGLQMTGTAVRRAHRPELKTLAAAVQATERDEAAMMTSWLAGWGKPTDVDTDSNLHADHGGLPATGPAEIKSLSTVRAGAFDTAFLNLFVAHQHNAVEMAHLETANGKNAEAKKLAERVRESRQGEIQQMLAMMNK